MIAAVLRVFGESKEHILATVLLFGRCHARALTA